MNYLEDTQKQHGGKGLSTDSDWRFYVVVIAAAFIIIVLRRPDAILNPQFCAEDGTVFYADAYNKGIITPLFSPCGGYLDTFPRLVAAFSQFFPLSWAPLLFNLASLAVKVLPVGLILSPRFCKLIPDLKTRLFLAFLYLALPNSWEVNAGLLHGKTYLSLLAFMVLSAGPGGLLSWHFFDAGVILLSGLSGPFCIMLTPIAALLWIHRRDKRSLTLFVLISICTVIQGIFLIAGDARPQLPLGATPELFFEILSSQVFLGALIGQRGLQLLLHFSTLYDVTVMIFTVVVLVAFINALLRAPLELRLFILYAFLLFCAALSSPLVNKMQPQWPLLLLPGVGGRYWFIPMLAFISVLVWSLRKASSRLSKTLATAAFAITIMGIILDWRYPAFKDLNFKEHAHRFEAAPIGTRAMIPINPPGWTITLIRH